MPYFQQLLSELLGLQPPHLHKLLNPQTWFAPAFHLSIYNLFPFYQLILFLLINSHHSTSFMNSLLSSLTSTGFHSSTNLTSHPFSSSALPLLASASTTLLLVTVPSTLQLACEYWVGSSSLAATVCHGAGAALLASSPVLVGDLPVSSSRGNEAPPSVSSAGCVAPPATSSFGGVAHPFFSPSRDVASLSLVEASGLQGAFFFGSAGCSAPGLTSFLPLDGNSFVAEAQFSCMTPIYWSLLYYCPF